MVRLWVTGVLKTVVDYCTTLLLWVTDVLKTVVDYCTTLLLWVTGVLKTVVDYCTTLLLWVTGVLKTVVDYCTTLLLSGRVVLLLVPATRCVWMWRVSYCMSSDATWILPQEHSLEIVHTVLPFL